MLPVAISGSEISLLLCNQVRKIFGDGSPAALLGSGTLPAKLISISESISVHVPCTSVLKRLVVGTSNHQNAHYEGLKSAEMALLNALCQRNDIKRQLQRCKQFRRWSELSASCAYTAEVLRFRPKELKRTYIVE